MKQQTLDAHTVSPNDWLLWQLADSAFPTGGFAHSNGLEAAWHHGEVNQSSDVLLFASAALQQLGQAAQPLVTAGYLEPERLAELDQLCDVFTTNHVANRASRLQGRAFLAAIQRTFGLSRIETSESVSAGEGIRAVSLAPPFGHLAPVFGSATRLLGLERKTALRLFYFQHLRSLVTAAVRLNIVGPIEAQKLQHRLGSQGEEIMERSMPLTLDDLAQTAPMLDVWQGSHDRLYSRLFQS